MPRPDGNVTIEAVRALLGELYPDAAIESVQVLAADATGRGDGTAKGVGYGTPVRIGIRRGNAVRHLVFHTATANYFGHDRRSDRAQGMLQAYDSFSAIPRHVAALDVGTVTREGTLRSLGDSGEFYLLTEYGEGSLYADDLRRIARTGMLAGRDRHRCALLADYLAALHAEAIEGAPRYRRAIRDLVGHGEGIFGIVDGYPEAVPAAPPERLRAIEVAAAQWRWRLRGREGRLARTHGDFHPFNIVFHGDDELFLLDASRGCLGDPADDITCLAVNYIFFALDQSAPARVALGELWRHLWRRYFAARSDPELLCVAPPYLAWRALVLANPVWYPAVGAAARDALLSWAEQVLAQGCLDLEGAEPFFAPGPEAEKGSLGPARRRAAAARR